MSINWIFIQNLESDILRPYIEPKILQPFDWLLLFNTNIIQKFSWFDQIVAYDGHSFNIDLYSMLVIFMFIHIHSN